MTFETGDRITRDGRTFEVVRITSAGSAGTSYADGPTFHARIVGPDGTCDPRGFVADIWSGSMSYPLAAYTLVQ